MFEIKDGVFTLTKTVKLTARQKEKIKSIKTDQQQNYLLSIMGLYKNTVKFPKQRPQLFYDPLLKPRNDILMKQKELSNSRREFRPLTTSTKTAWLGVEVECLVPGNEGGICEYCDEGRVSCDNCDGTGHIKLEDANGNEYRVDCSECSGEGYRTCDECGGSWEGDSDSSEIFAKIRRKLSDAGVRRATVKDDGSLGDMDDHIGVRSYIII
jgi:hypothetical protein